MYMKSFGDQIKGVKKCPCFNNSRIKKPVKVPVKKVPVKKRPYILIRKKLLKQKLAVLI